MEEKDISLRLATLRTKKKVSAREMSLAIGQNPNYINHIETGSATPSLESMARAGRKVYDLLTLKTRAGKGKLPQVYIVNMKEEVKKKNFILI